VNKIKTNDTVAVMKGRDRGRQGQVRKVIPTGARTNKYGAPRQPRVIVTGVNMVKRHLRPRSQQKPGGIIEREAPVSWSNVALVCPSCTQPTRVGFRMAGERKVRFCKRCNENIDKVRKW
jgi:large subunit ribosomal protein L24